MYKAHHHINTGNARTVKLGPRLLSPAEQVAERIEFNARFKKSCWNQVILYGPHERVLVPKPDGSTRSCLIHVATVNRPTAQDSYRIPAQHSFCVVVANTSSWLLTRGLVTGKSLLLQRTVIKPLPLLILTSFVQLSRCSVSRFPV